MKKLTGALLIFGIFASTAVAQSMERAMKERQKVLAGWLATVKTAESKYKGQYGFYGDLDALRKSQTLDALIFEPDKESDGPTAAEPDANLVPEGTRFIVSAPDDGKHFRVDICEVVDGRSLCVFGSEMGGGFSYVDRPPPMPEDGLPG